MMKPFYIFILVLNLAGGCAFADVPANVYLTWTKPDTATTMTILYHSAALQQTATVHYDQTSQKDIATYKFQQQSESKIFTHPNRTNHPVRRRVHRFELSGLQPNTIYFFTISNSTKALVKEFKFRTLPNDESTIRFVSGGDIGTASNVVNMHKAASAKNPYFAVIGGDIAYANGNIDRYQRWDTWFRYWQNNMVTPDGVLIPILATPGNHESQTSFGGNATRAPMFQAYLNPTSESSYKYWNAGKNAVFLALDTDHISRIQGAQTTWLKETLTAFQAVPFKFPFYHVPLYPSARGFDSQTAMKTARANWLPLFDQFKVRVAFENHDHALKRSKELFNGEAVSAGKRGTVYLGDGCWARAARNVSKRPYLEKSSSKQHVWYGEITPTHVQLQAISPTGEVLDSTSVLP